VIGGMRSLAISLVALLSGMVLTFSAIKTFEPIRSNQIPVLTTGGNDVTIEAAKIMARVGLMAFTAVGLIVFGLFKLFQTFRKNKQCPPTWIG